MSAAIDNSGFAGALAQMQQTNQSMLDYQKQSVAENRKFAIESASLEHEASVTNKLKTILQTLARNTAS